jgi:glycosyltransferase involved in cell wall biosynthesis
VHYEEQRGKGFALKYGFDNVRGADLVAFIDADMELHPDGIGRLVEILEAEHVDAVIGSKTHPDSIVSYPAFRRVQSNVFRGIVRALFRLDVTDTQTGLKVFRKPLLDDIMPLLQSTGFAFDLELLVYANDMGYRILEGPVDLDYRFSSTTGVPAVLDVLRDVAQIARRRLGLRRAGLLQRRSVVVTLGEERVSGALIQD